MIASLTIPVTTGHSRFLWHGRSQRQPPEKHRPADQRLDIFWIARQRAREFERVSLVISHWSNQHWNVVFADRFKITDDDLIEYVAWPPQWFYRPTPGRLDWLHQWHPKP